MKKSINKRTYLLNLAFLEGATQRVDRNAVWLLGADEKKITSSRDLPCKHVQAPMRS